MEQLVSSLLAYIFGYIVFTIYMFFKKLKE